MERTSSDYVRPLPKTGKARAVPRMTSVAQRAPGETEEASYSRFVSRFRGSVSSVEEEESEDKESSQTRAKRRPRGCQSGSPGGGDGGYTGGVE